MCIRDSRCVDWIHVVSGVLHLERLITNPDKNTCCEESDAKHVFVSNFLFLFEFLAEKIRQVFIELHSFVQRNKTIVILHLSL